MDTTRDNVYARHAGYTNYDLYRAGECVGHITRDRLNHVWSWEVIGIAHGTAESLGGCEIDATCALRYVDSPTGEHPPCIHCGEPAIVTGECLNPDCSHCAW